MTYTKGKWEPIYQLYKKAPKKICIGVGINTRFQGGMYTEFICNSMLPETDKDYIKQSKEIEANMKLIAAAPELLEVLLQFIHSVEHEGVIEGRVVDAVRNAKEAIKKATE